MHFAASFPPHSLHGPLWSARATASPTDPCRPTTASCHYCLRKESQKYSRTLGENMGNEYGVYVNGRLMAYCENTTSCMYMTCLCRNDKHGKEGKLCGMCRGLRTNSKPLTIRK